MLCAKCSTENPVGMKFCNECGAAFGTLCASCGFENAPGAKFCGQCGTALGAPAAPSARKSADRQIHVADTPASENIAGERKTVTALFADIKGSTELMEDLDPEDARAIIDPALRVMIDAVKRYDGYVVQSTGDGIFALFGAPVAHEDHPQRALYSALRMQDELRRYSAKLVADGGMPIEARVGINTGEVVVRTIATSGANTEYTPIGHTANLASRMQAVAPTGSIAISEHTRRLVEGYFALKALGPTKVKGVSEPVNVYEVTGLGPLRTRLQRAAGRGLTKFVGREREMETLKRAAGQARSGRGQIAAAIAEAGTGKSRLFFEFKVTSQAGWMLLETFSVSHGKASAYLPIIELLRNYFDISAADDERKRREKVTGRVLALDRNLEDTLPYLFALLGIVEGDDPLAQMEVQVKKRRTLEAIKRIVLRESINQPLIVIFEDLHWLDEHTQDLLNLLADSIGTAKVLLLVNYRPEYSHQWNSKTYYTQLRLDPLGRESADEMLSALLGGGDDLAPLKRLIIQKTEGTPFFMEETVQVLFDDGALIRNGVVKLTRPLAELKIPPTVQAILASRIDRLPADAKELLQTLAVIGREFPLSLIRAVITKSDDDLYRLLNDLQLGEFIYEQPAVGDTEYIFKHALTQEVAYNSVLNERRKQLHERIGAAFETLYADSLEDHLAELAHHYGRSSNLDVAVQYLTSAGKQKMEEAQRLERELAGAQSASAPGERPTLTGDVHSPGASAEAVREETERVGELGAVLGSVDTIWRYPVKSMAGEEIPVAKMTARGMLGDRVYALVDKASNRTATVRSWAAPLLNYRVQFVTEPDVGAPVPDVRITLPGGLELTTSDPDIHHRLSAAFDRNLTMMATAPAGLMVEHPDEHYHGAIPDLKELPIAMGAAPGEFFDYGCVHLLATSTIDHLQSLYPQGRFDVRRFRPNFVVRTQAEPFIENSWIGHTIAVGDEVVLRITIPCPRCVSMILPQFDLPHDPGILRTIAQHNMQDLGDFGMLPCAGVYADVVRPGRIRRGDTMRYID
jgi:class 3 adenylate cyclase/uncharacterized protein YcbX